MEKDLKNNQLVVKKSPEEIDPKHKTSDTAVEKKLFSSASQKLSSEHQQFQVVLGETLTKEKQPLGSSRTIAEVPSSRSSTDVETSATAAAAYVESKQEEQQKDERGYVTREAFLNLLQRDVNEWKRQLEQNLFKKVPSRLNTLILAKAIDAAERLFNTYTNIPSAKLSSDLATQDFEPILPSIRMLRENLAGDGQSILPRKRMTPLEFDQEFYDAIKDQAMQVLQYSKNNNTDELRYCLDYMNCLDSYSQFSLTFNQELSGMRYDIITVYEELSHLSDGEEQNYLELEQLAELQKKKDELVQCTDQAADALCLGIEEYFGSNGGDVEKWNATFVRVLNHLDLLRDEWVAQKTNLAAAIQDARAKKIQPVRDFITSDFGPDVGISRANNVPVSTNQDALKSSNNLERHQNSDVLVENLISDRSERRSLFDGPFRLTALLGSITALVAALAYEWHLHFLHNNNQIASS